MCDVIYEYNGIAKQRYLSLSSKRKQIIYIIEEQPTCAQIWIDHEGYVLSSRIREYLMMGIDDLLRAVESDEKPELEFNNDRTLIRIK